jgi:anaphase-promoting complex subunit 4
MAKPGARASYEDTKKAIELLKEGATFMGDALCLEQVLGHLGTGVTGLLKQVSAWQENNIQMDSGIVLEDTDEETMQTVDMRMVVEVYTRSLPYIYPISFCYHTKTSQSNETSTYILLSPNPSSSTLHIHRLTHTQSITSLPKDIHSYAITTLDFSHTGNSTTILDAKFADDKTLLLLLQQDQKQQQDTNPGKQQSKTLIISIPYTPPPHPPSHIQTRNHSPLIQYTPLPSEHLPSTLLPRGAAAPTALRQTVAMTPHVIEKHTRHVFEGRFTPLKLIVNGRKGRRVIVVLGSDRKHYRVLDMDYRQRRARAEGEDGTDGSETEEDGGGMGDGDVEMSGA